MLSVTVITEAFEGKCPNINTYTWDSPEGARAFFKEQSEVPTPLQRGAPNFSLILGGKLAYMTTKSITFDGEVYRVSQTGPLADLRDELVALILGACGND